MSLCHKGDVAYHSSVPALWNDTIESHRREVGDAILDAAWELVEQRGLLSVTMTQIAAGAGIGRATLYKYFPDVSAVLSAWHERQITGHLSQLAGLSREGGSGRRLEELLRALADLSHRSNTADLDLAAVLRRGHSGDHATRARQHLHSMIVELIAEGRAAGELRGDVPPDELGTYCLHAISAAGSLSSGAAVQRLVDVTMSALTPPR